MMYYSAGLMLMLTFSCSCKTYSIGVVTRGGTPGAARDAQCIACSIGVITRGGTHGAADVSGAGYTYA